MAMDLTTRCPKCGTVFSATLAQLQLRKGFVRCISCANIFDGYEAVVPSDDPLIHPGAVSPRPEPPGPVAAVHVQSTKPAAWSGAAPHDRLAPLPETPQVVRPRTFPDSPGMSMASTQAAGLQLSPGPSRDAGPADSAPLVGPADYSGVSLMNRPDDQPAPPEPFIVPVAPVLPRSQQNEPRAPFTVSSRPTLVGHAEPSFHVGGGQDPASETRFSVTDDRPPQARIGVSYGQEPGAPEVRAERSPADDARIAKLSSGSPDTVFARHDIQSMDPAVHLAPEPVLYVEPRRDHATPGRTRTPGFMATPSSTASSLTDLLWGGLLLLALAALAVQAAYVYRVQLANNFPELRPSLEALCEQAKCTVPYSREIRQIVIVSSALRSQAASGSANGKGMTSQAQSASDAGRVVLDFVMRNTYDKPQEWPTLVLTMNDFSGALIARKNLPPSVYLPQSLRDQPFAPGAQLDVQLPLVVNAGVRINGYQIDKFFQ